MKHLGDITHINGAEIEPVDVITGGSPCQDLSVAGKRAGLAGERSGLYMDQIRIIKEMREHDRSVGRTGELVRPRYMVWENVPGAFSSNGGKDFGAVLEEAIRVSEPEAPDVPVPDGGWPVAGWLYTSDGSWSVAWRQHDAQYWGTPQRRKRIALVADFGGSTAAEILFERKGVPGNTEPGGAAGKGSAGDTEGSAGSAGFSGGQGSRAGGIGWQKECSPSLKSSPSGTNTIPSVLINTVYVCYNGENITSRQCRQNPRHGDPSHTLGRDSRNYVLEGTLDNDLLENWIVRRLTPMECERLQGFPDGWTDIGDWTDSKGKLHKASDTPRYKALGNSIAVGYANNRSGFWMWLMKRISAQYERTATLGSLFDGIGGFPLAWEAVNGKGTARWASEIEEFPIAVTKYHFPEVEL